MLKWRSLAEWTAANNALERVMALHTALKELANIKVKGSAEANAARRRRCNEIGHQFRVEILILSRQAAGLTPLDDTV